MSHFEYVSVGRRLSGLSPAPNSNRNYWVLATWIFVLAGCGGGGGSSSSSPIPAPAEPPVPAVFADPGEVAILGYEGDAMEPEISHDGEIMFFNNLNAQSLPGAGVNDIDDLEYAADLSDDGLELFFTRLIQSETALDFGVYTAVRESETSPWGEAVRIEAIKGEVTEGPSITSDGRTLYYHARETGIHRIYAVTRP